MEAVALCVGINQFASSRIPALAGCVNDAQAMAEFLGARQYKATILTDEAARLAAVRQWMAATSERARAGTVKRVFLSVSSHGTQIPDGSGDEADGMDEALVFYDTQPGPDGWTNVLTDDEIGAWISGLPAGCAVELVIDACHSGTATRGLDGNRSRTLPALKRLRNRIAWSACRDDQTAADTVQEGRACGAFTWAWLRAAKTAGRPADVLAVCAGLLRGAGYSQVPQLEVR
jgi:metacaspase-1